jgi:hypothetical protein
MRPRVCTTSEYHDPELRAWMIREIEAHRKKHKGLSGGHPLNLGNLYGSTKGDHRFLVTWLVLAKEYRNPPWRVSREDTALLIYMPSHDRENGAKRGKTGPTDFYNLVGSV